MLPAAVYHRVTIGKEDKLRSQSVQTRCTMLDYTISDVHSSVGMAGSMYAPSAPGLRGRLSRLER